MTLHKIKLTKKHKWKVRFSNWHLLNWFHEWNFLSRIFSSNGFSLSPWIYGITCLSLKYLSWIFHSNWSSSGFVTKNYFNWPLLSFYSWFKLTFGKNRKNNNVFKHYLDLNNRYKQGNCWIIFVQTMLRAHLVTIANNININLFTENNEYYHCTLNEIYN